MTPWAHLGRRKAEIWIAKFLMKTTKYFDFRRQKPDRKDIQDEWIQRVIDSPIRTEVQSDGRIKIWGRIEEVDKYLRVILLEDCETVHNAFFDRSFKGDE